MNTSTSIGDCFRSQVDFLLAELKDETALPDRAGDFITWRKGRFITIRELVDECGSHRYGGLVYEAWAWETARRVRAIISDLSPIAARAMVLYAKHTGTFEMDAEAMMEALRLAQRELYGDPLEM